MKRVALPLFMMVIAGLLFFSGCDPDEQNPDPTPTPTYPKVFKCLINGVPYEATAISSSGSYTNGTPVAKGIKHSMGSTTMDGDIRWLLNFGTDSQGNLVTGVHTPVTQISTIGNNQGKVTIKDFTYFNNNAGYLIENQGTVTVTEYYFRSSDNTYLGAKGTFDNLKIGLFNMTTMTEDTLVLTQGVFDFKQQLP